MPVVNILLPVAPDHTRLTKVVAALIYSLTTTNDYIIMHVTVSQRFQTKPD